MDACVTVDLGFSNGTTTNGTRQWLIGDMALYICFAQVKGNFNCNDFSRLAR